MNVLRSLAFYCVFYTLSVFYVLSAILVILVVPRWITPVAVGWSSFHHACVRHILQIKISETGERITGPALYAVRHESFFEAIDLPRLLDHPAVLAKDELFAIPGWGRAAQAYGVIPVARKDGARALRDMLRQARAMVESGRPLAIFPEGTRVAHGKVAPLQAGFAALYKTLGVPVVPVAVNSGPLYHRLWKRRGTITIHFGAPILPGLSRAEVEAQVSAAINALDTGATPQRLPAAPPAT